MNRLQLTLQAEKDLADIFTRMVQQVRFFGDDAARSYSEGLKVALEQLARFPLNGRAEHDIDARTRSMPYREHVIYYEPTHEGIIVLRILPDPEAYAHQPRY